MNLSLPPGSATAPDRGRIPSLGTLVLLAALAWGAVILWARSPAMMDAMPGQVALASTALFAGMWLLMMVAMMLPAVIPIVLLFRTIQLRHVTDGRPAIPTTVFVAGYLLVWAVAGLLADLVYVAAQDVGARLQAGSASIPLIGAGILALAGLYQLSPLKYVCLAHCRSPFHFVLHSWREGRRGALRMGVSHGAYCLGCCWGIMAVLFVVGLMNLAWMAALSVLIVVEKLAPWGVAVGRVIGVVFIALGVCMAVRPQLFPASGLQPATTLMASMPMENRTQEEAPSGSTQHASAMVGPYAVTLTMLPRGRFIVSVTDRSMGMPVTGAHISLRFSGMGAPNSPVVVPALPGQSGRMSGTYATTVSLMPGAYLVRVTGNGSAAIRPRHVLGCVGLQYLWPTRYRQDAISRGVLTPSMPLERRRWLVRFRPKLVQICVAPPKARSAAIMHIHRS